MLADFVPPGTAELAVPADRPGGDLSGDWVLLVEPVSSSLTWPPASSSPMWPAVHSSSVQTRTTTTAANRKKHAPPPPPPPPPGTSWVSSVDVSASRVRSDASVVGCSFVATQNMTVTHLCRLLAPESGNVEQVAVYDSDTGAVVAAAATDALAPAFQDANGFICAAAVAVATTTAAARAAAEVAAAPVAAAASTTAMPATATTAAAQLVAGKTYVISLLADSCDLYYDDSQTRVEVVGGDAAKVTSVYVFWFLVSVCSLTNHHRQQKYTHSHTQTQKGISTPCSSSARGGHRVCVLLLPFLGNKKNKQQPPATTTTTTTAQYSYGKHREW